MKVSFTYLLTFIFILGLTANSFPSSGKGDDAKVLHEKTFKISPGKKLLVNAASGDVQITAWDKSEVYVKVIGNDNAADKFDFSFNANSEEVKIDAEKKDGWSWFSNIKLKFEIKVPANFNVYTNTSGGDIKIGGVKGGITLKTSGGDIWGDRFEGNFNAKTSGGDIKIKVPQNIDADVDLRTSGGDVECNMNLNNVKRLSDSKIIGSLNKGGVPLNAHTSGGDITLSRK